MKILSIDSSALPVSCAVLDGGRMTAEFTISLKLTHSETLMPLLDELLKKSGTEPESIDALAVSGGPGSFTGLRIGSATVKGLGDALNIPVISVPTLEALAYNVFSPDALVVPMMDARRKNVYTGIYEYEGEELKEVLPQCIIPLKELAEKLDHLDRRVIFTGDGIYVFKEELDRLLRCEHLYAPSHLSMQRAGAVAALAEKLYLKGCYTDASSHRPDYLKPSQAEQELKSAEKEGRLGELAEGTYISRKKAAMSEKPEKKEDRGDGILIRQMKKEDASELSRLESSVFGSNGWTEKDFVETTAVDYAYYLVAEDTGDKRILGLCGYRDMCGEADVTNVCVLPEMRRRGIAERLLKSLISYGEEHGVADFTLEVRSSNTPAIDLYKKLGFASEGIRPGFYEDPKDDALIMWKRKSSTAKDA